MALSSVSYTGDGTTRLFAVTIPYLEKAHVKVYVGGVEDTTFTWTTASSITTTGTPALSAIVLIKRTTPTAPLVDFVDGSTLTESLLDTSNLQNLYVSEETQDAATLSLALDSTDNKFNANSKVIKNLGTPVANTDAVTKEYVDVTIPANVASASASASSASASAISASASAVAAATFDPSAYLPIAGGSLTGLLNVNDGADIASATTVDLTTATGNTVRITGTTAITAFTMYAGQQMELVAVGALPLTYHATTMNINGGVSYTCAAGDRLSVFKDGAGVIQINVTKQDGTAVVSAVSFATQSDYNTGTDTTKALNSSILRSNNLVLGTSIATTSGTAHDYTGIPSWAKRITVMLKAVSLSGSAAVRVQLGGAGGIENTGYTGLSAHILVASANAASLSAGVDFGVSAASTNISGSVVFTKLDGSTWTFFGIGSSPTGTILSSQVSGVKALSAALTQLRITSTNGTDTFDAGSINIMYE